MVERVLVELTAMVETAGLAEGSAAPFEDPKLKLGAMELANPL